MIVAAAYVACAFVFWSPVSRKLDYDAYEQLGTQKPWQDASSFNLEEVTMRWSFPPSAYEDEGLGGGITFALHRSFCSRMMDDEASLFPEADSVLGDLFLSCEYLRNAIARAMGTWAINHKNINFKDVTEACWEEKGTEKCEHAELFIVPDDSDGEEGTAGLAAWVDPDYNDLDLKPYSTSGREVHSFGLRRARMTLRAPATADEFCWYLDASFCAYFHQPPWESGFNPVEFWRVLFSMMFGVSLVFVLWVIVQAGHATLFAKEGPADAARSSVVPAGPVSRQTSTGISRGTSEGVDGHACGSVRCTRLLEFLAVMNSQALLVALFTAIFCPTFYLRIYQPCWECYDFEATVAHEVGHVLGFHHPDQLPNLNLEANVSMASCALDEPPGQECLFELAAGAPSAPPAVAPPDDACCLHPFEQVFLNPAMCAPPQPQTSYPSPHPNPHPSLAPLRSKGAAASPLRPAS
jgi:hypothetical protein